jgi:hypothetical protein
MRRDLPKPVIPPPPQGLVLIVLVLVTFVAVERALEATLALPLALPW